jgi:hypothetical protein
MGTWRRVALSGPRAMQYPQPLMALPLAWGEAGAPARPSGWTKVEASE